MGILLEKVDGQDGMQRPDEGTPGPLGRDISDAIFPRKGMPENF